MTTTADRLHAAGVPGYSKTWRCKPQTVRRARDLVGTALNTWGLACLVDRGTLIVSELVTNSVNHSRCKTVRVSITRPGRELVIISVFDKSKKLPAPLGPVPGEDMEDGRGLLLVDAMADRWKVHARERGKIVRAELHVKGDG